MTTRQCPARPAVAQAPPQRSPLVLPDSALCEATVLREELTAAPGGASGRHSATSTLSFGQQPGTPTRPAGVCPALGLPGRDHHVPHRDLHYPDHYLDVMHTHTA
ncbi:hypothetical protein GCM10022284_68610 [Streptomyces hundungensis]